MALVRWVGRAIGIDVHRDVCVVVICEDGKVRSGGRVALEVTGSCWEVARTLEPYVNRVVVVSPDDTGIVQARAKDRPSGCSCVGEALVARGA